MLSSVMLYRGFISHDMLPRVPGHFCTRCRLGLGHEKGSNVITSNLLLTNANARLNLSRARARARALSQGRIKEIQHASKALSHYQLHHTIGGEALKALQKLLPGTSLPSSNETACPFVLS